MGSIGFKEILLIVVIILILFGAKRIPEMMRAMGQGLKEFKKASRDVASDDDTTPHKPTTSGNHSAPAAKSESDKQA
jgi:sec-independent protein translocase protein TatA